MKYDFNSTVDRLNHDALAVDAARDEMFYKKEEKVPGFSDIPMWVADMNFKTFPKIQDSIIERVNHPMFGYFNYRDEYYNSIIYWQNKRNGVKDLKKENIGYENGVLGGLSSALKAIIKEGDPVLVNSPTYIGFTKCLSLNGYKIILSPLVKDENNKWMMDYSDMDKKIKEYNIKVGIICNPHNPCGRCWSKEELEKATDVYRKNNCIIISDEIWSDIINPLYKHIPTQSISDDIKMRTIALYAPSKTFNLAGLIGSYHIIYNDNLNSKVKKEGEKTFYNSMNVLSQYALIAAYSEEGSNWTDELNIQIKNNIDFAYDFIKENFKGINLFKPEATYMLYLDLNEYLKNNNKTLDDVLRKSWNYGVLIQDGRPFNYDNSIRINLASPLEIIKEAFRRLKKYVL